MRLNLHFLGTATLSFADGARAQPGDRVEVELPDSCEALVNPLAMADPDFSLDAIRVL